MPDISLDLPGALAKLFIERRDVKAVQKKDGIYNPVEQKWTKQDIENHLSGRMTYGHYLIDPATNNCRVMCFDIDLTDEFRREFHSLDQERVGWLTAELRCFALGLARQVEESLEIPTAQLFSGNKGIHVYGFTGSTPASLVREAAYGVLSAWDKTLKPKRGDQFWALPAYPELEIEVFPKQDEVENGHFGNLLRLPLGVHKKSGKPSFFLDPSASLWELVPADPAEVLSRVAS